LQAKRDLWRWGAGLSQVFQLRGGRIVRIDFYLDRAHALEAAELSE
jgi:ketosteroid isomerase-like protein